MGWSVVLAAVNSSEAASFASIGKESTSGMLAALVVLGTLGAVLLAPFVLVRNSFPGIYQPKALRYPKMKPAPSRLWDLVRSMLRRQKSDKLLREQGMDALVYIRFVELSTILCAAVGLVSLVVLMPINAHGNYSKEGNTTLSITGLDTFSISNVAPGSNKLWAHLTVLFVNTLMVWTMLFFFFRKYMHYTMMYSRSGGIHHNSVLVKGVPPTWSTKHLYQVVVSAFPGVSAIERVVVIKDLDKAKAKRDQTIFELERAVLKLEKTGQRPTHRVGPGPVHGCLCLFPCVEQRVVDSIDFYRDQWGQLESVLACCAPYPLPASSSLHGPHGSATSSTSSLSGTSSGPILSRSSPITVRDTATSLITSSPVSEATTSAAAAAAAATFTATSPDGAAVGTNAEFRNRSSSVKRVGFTPYAFVIFSTAASSLLCQEKGLSTGNLKLECLPAPHPHDIIWHAFALPHKEIVTRCAVSVTLITLIVLSWGVLMTFVSGIGSLTYLSQLGPFGFLAGLIDQGSIIVGLLQGLLPPVVTLVLVAVVPSFIRCLVAHMGVKRNSVVDNVSAFLYFFFMLENVLLVTTIAGSVFNDLYLLMADEIDLAEMLAGSIPMQTTYFANYVMLITVLGPVLSLGRVIPLIKLYIVPKLFTCSKRDLRNLTDVSYPNYTISCARCMLVIVVCTTFGNMAPIVVPFCVAFFVFTYFSDNYVMRYVQQRKYEGGGRIFKSLYHCTLLGLLIYQLSILGVLEMKEFPWSTIALFLPFSTVALWVFLYCMFGKHGYTPEFETAPLSPEMVPSMIRKQFCILQEEALSFHPFSFTRSPVEYEQQGEEEVGPLRRESPSLTIVSGDAEQPPEEQPPEEQPEAEPQLSPSPHVSDSDDKALLTGKPV
eukprot:TRINITY_DN1597_c0_g2_i1.p1 TRINITY_DN1597_c0_g2~~TRINITY_DN1597_c0_g2_i1.p1  ORF type:complete len:919 (-),score=191.42 TRINITY_DN1597_c0_g2_i1:71-2722(-)